MQSNGWIRVGGDNWVQSIGWNDVKWAGSSGGGHLGSVNRVE